MEELTGNYCIAQGCPKSTLLATTKLHTCRFIRTPKSWDDAQMFCESLGGNLFVPNDLDENDSVALVAPEWTALWIGGTDQQSEGTWVDPNGTGLTFTNWNLHASQPNGAGNCVIMDTRQWWSPWILGKWWDDNCSNKRPSICEF